MFGTAVRLGRTPPQRHAAMLVDANSPNAGGVTGAIRQASRVTGTSFQYLLAAAKVESGLDPSAAARSSSAGGLFQFIDQTWLGTLKQAGASLGYGRYAQAIQQTDSGRYVVSDPALRSEIMKLRRDPTANAMMAGALTQSNANYLTQKLGRAPNDGELYMAHFLGARGAAKLIGLSQATPSAIAADSFPQAARANRSIFYASGRPRSFADVTRVLSGRYDVAAAATARIGGNTAPKAPAVATVARVARAYEAAASVRPLIAAPTLPPPSAAMPAISASASLATNAPTLAAPRDIQPAPTPSEHVASAFRDLFLPTHADMQAAADAPAGDTAAPDDVPEMPTANALAPLTSAAPQVVASVNSIPASDEPFGLFQDIRPNVRALFTGG
jgi:hypothetical protein